MLEILSSKEYAKVHIAINTMREYLQTCDDALHTFLDNAKEGGAGRSIDLSHMMNNLATALGVPRLHDHGPEAWRYLLYSVVLQLSHSPHLVHDLDALHRAWWIGDRRSGRFRHPLCQHASEAVLEWLHREMEAFLDYFAACTQMQLRDRTPSTYDRVRNLAAETLKSIYET